VQLEQADARPHSIEVRVSPWKRGLQEKYTYPVALMRAQQHEISTTRSIRPKVLPICLPVSANARRVADAVVYEGLTMIGKDRSHIGCHQS